MFLVIKQQYSMEDDTLILWEDNILGPVESGELFSGNVLELLKSKTFPSKLKTIFWRLVCLMIFKIEEKISESNFHSLIRKVLSDFTNDSKLIDGLANGTEGLCKRLETYNPLVDNLKLYNFCSNKPDNLRTLTEEQNNHLDTAVLHDIFQYPPLQVDHYLNYCDFSLSGRLKLVLLSVITEMGFNEFSTNVEKEIENIRKFEIENSTLAVYENLKHCVLNNVLYLTRYTYGALYNRLYVKDVKGFVDKL